MELTSKVPLYIFIYAFLITLLPALMVSFFTAGGLFPLRHRGGEAFQSSCLFRYLTTLTVMVLGRTPQAKFPAIFGHRLTGRSLVGTGGLL